MIRLGQNKDCCGCEGCAQRCPVGCIAMQPDAEGFLYPQIDRRICINCGMCEKICPVLNQGSSGLPLKIYAAKNRNEEIRKASSSGGVFTALAEAIIEDGGVVFGAKFSEGWEVVHDYTETKPGLTAFRGSKYVQSRIGRNFEKAEFFLNRGRKVLFSGTPCQIAGLKLFLRKKYENLLTVDFACHGVPSPFVWQTYLRERVIRKEIGIENISFRDKRLGWQNFSFTVTFSCTETNGSENRILLSEPFKKNVFMKGFLANLYLRPSCHACPSKCFKSDSDLTMGDYWGIGRYHAKFDDDRGISLVFIHTQAGAELYAKLKIENKETTFRQAIAANKVLERSVACPVRRGEFWTGFYKEGIIAAERIAPNRSSGVFSFMKNIIKRIIDKK